MDEILISIIVPIYNVEKYLCEGIESIQNQTYKQIEIILVDDGSPDNCLEICNQYAQKDSRIIVIHQKNGGVSSARNTGLKRATGEYIGFVDPDDTIEPQMFEEMLKLILSNNTQMCVSTGYLMRHEIFYNSKTHKQNYTKKEAMKELLHMNFPTSLWSCLYENKIIKNVSLNEKIHYWEDFEFQLRILDNVDKISLCDFTYYHYRQRADSINHQSINDKSISCLVIPEEVNNIFSIKYPEFKKDAKNLYIHFLQIIIGCLSKSSQVENKYFKIVTSYSRRYFLRSIYFKDITLKMKLYIFICMINAKIFWKLYSLMKNQ